MDSSWFPQRSASFHAPVTKSPSFLGLRRTLSSSRSDGLWEPAHHDPEKGLAPEQSFAHNYQEDEDAEDIEVPWVTKSSSKAKRSVRLVKSGQSMWQHDMKDPLEATGAAMQFVAKNISASSRLLMVGCAAILMIVGCIGVNDMFSIRGDSIHADRSFAVTSNVRSNRRLMEANPMEQKLGSAVGSEVAGGLSEGKISKLLKLVQNPRRFLNPIERAFREIVKEGLEKSAQGHSFLSGKKSLLYYPSLYEMCLPTVQEWRDAFLCAIGDAVKVNRTWIMDSQFCVEANSVPGHPYRSVLDFHLYYDVEKLKKKLGGNLMESSVFWDSYDVFNMESEEKVEITDASVTEGDADLSVLEDPIVRRTIPKTWSSVCDSDKTLERPQNTLQMHPSLMDVASLVARELGHDFDSVFVDPNADHNIQLVDLFARIKNTVKPGRRIFLVIGDLSPHLFDSLRDTYRVFTLHDFHDMWSPSSEWSRSMKNEAGRKSKVIFDSYMRYLVNEELMYRSKEKINAMEDYHPTHTLTNNKRSSLRLRLGGFQ